MMHLICHLICHDTHTVGLVFRFRCSFSHKMTRKHVNSNAAFSDDKSKNSNKLCTQIWQWMWVNMLVGKESVRCGTASLLSFISTFSWQKMALKPFLIFTIWYLSAAACCTSKNTPKRVLKVSYVGHIITVLLHCHLCGCIFTLLNINISFIYLFLTMHVLDFRKYWILTMILLLQ